MLLITGGSGGVVWCGGAVRHVQRADSYHVRYEAIRSRYDTISTRDTVLYSTVLCNAAAYVQPEYEKVCLAQLPPTPANHHRQVVARAEGAVGGRDERIASVSLTSAARAAFFKPPRPAWIPLQEE